MKIDQDKVDDTLSRKAFAIEKKEAELVNGIPVSGEDYLLLVRQQAEKCLQTVIAPPPQQIKQLDLPFEYQFTKDTPTNPNVLPDLEWQKLFVSCFEAFRTKQQNTKHTIVSSPGMPVTNQQWRAYCTTLKMDDSRLLETIAPLQQKTILKLLKLNKEWLQSAIEDTSLSSSLENTWSCHVMWIFSLLVYVDPVLTSMDISILRDVCRTCIDLRNRYQRNRNQVIQLNIIITIISISFRQSDLQ
ncbi:survival motor neuron interacting protein 1-domain-containing protein [Chlamydoabsidia padenii]|nr:survival motor neuron interacting protein 1-domain-containing protein [Chlamydoabsidia padenii]